MVDVNVAKVRELLFKGPRTRSRLLQDTPILPDVWLKYADSPKERCDVLLTPTQGVSPFALFNALRGRLNAYWKTSHWSASRRPTVDLGLTYNESHVVCCLFFDELICAALPMTPWWRKWIAPMLERKGDLCTKLRSCLEDAKDRDRLAVATLAGLVGYLEGVRQDRFPAQPRDDKIAPDDSAEKAELARLAAPVLLCAKLARTARTADAGEAAPQPLWLVSENRTAQPALSLSVSATKADAARNLFKISCKGLCWAVVDTGIDATHPAFRMRRSNAPDKFEASPFPAGRIGTRIKATFDFVHLRSLLDVTTDLRDRGKRLGHADRRKLLKDVDAALESGRMLDWSSLVPLVSVPHETQAYQVPPNPHGTHVAGILAADWPDYRDGLAGMCPDLQLYDMRVLDDEGGGEEFSILAALQFIRYLNGSSDVPVVHGVNLSMSLPRHFDNFACGRTPICEECNRLVASGVTVVVAAGNEGCVVYNAKHGSTIQSTEGWQLSSITDPGSAESVITVGSTHRFQPHTYGVSFFSGRGPTGDGRQKPDLLAPGEKICSTTPDGHAETMDGTSMAAPHVSGAAALLMAKHRELIRDPIKIKQVLCATATDLGRHHWLQGAGMLDVLRAIQSV